jgi:hypothetical protein
LLAVEVDLGPCDHADCFSDELVGVLILVKLLAVLEAFVIDGFKDCHFSPQQHSHPVPIAGYVLDDAALGVQFGVHELRDNGCQHVEISLHDGLHFFGDIFFLSVGLERTEIGQLSLDLLQYLLVAFNGGDVQTLLELTFFLIIIDDRLNNRWIVILFNHFDEFLFLLLCQPHRSLEGGAYPG